MSWMAYNLVFTIHKRRSYRWALYSASGFHWFDFQRIVLLCASDNGCHSNSDVIGEQLSMFSNSFLCASNKFPSTFFFMRYATRHLDDETRYSLFPLYWSLLNRIQQIKSEIKVFLHLPQFPFFLRVVQYLCCLPLSFLVYVCFFLAKSWSNALRKPLHESGKSVNRWGKTLLSVNKPELCLVTMEHKKNSSRVRPTYLRMYLCSKSVFRSRYSSQTRLCDNPVTWSAVWFYKNTEKSSRLDFKPTSAPASLWFCICRHSQGKLLIRGWKVSVSCYQSLMKVPTSFWRSFVFPAVSMRMAEDFSKNDPKINWK